MVANVQRSPHTGTHSAGSLNCKLQILNCKLRIDNAGPDGGDEPSSRSANLPSAIGNWHFAIAFLPFAFIPPSPVLGWSTGKLWQQVSDAVCSAVMSDVRLTQFACLAVVLGLFLLWWRK